MSYFIRLHCVIELYIKLLLLGSFYRVYGSASSPEENFQCPEFIKQRSFVPSQYSGVNNPPTLLWTFPGSGNTWARMIIEYGSGFYSGALYDDSSLHSAFPGEGKCGPNVIIVKSHHKIEEIRQYSNNCHIKPFNRAIVVSRDPYDAIFAEYQRNWLTANKRREDSHYGKIPLSQFKIDDFKKQIIELSHWYHRLESRDFPMFLSEHGPDSILLIKFENLTRSSNEAKSLIISNMISFVTNKLDTSIFSQRMHRLDCVMYLANRSDINRSSSNFSIPHLIKDELYKSHPEIVCQIWKMISTDARKHGYGPYGGISC